MKQAYFIQETTTIIQILDETYNEMLAALRCRNPKVEQLIEDEEICQLHDLLFFLRLGYLQVQWVQGEKGRIALLEILT